MKGLVENAKPSYDFTGSLCYESKEALFLLGLFGFGSSLRLFLLHDDPAADIGDHERTDYNTDEDVRRSRQYLESIGVTRIDEFTYQRRERPSAN